MSETAIHSISLDRKDAIQSAIKDARPDDLILIAGKVMKPWVYPWVSYVFNDYDIAFSEIIRRNKFQMSQSWVLNQPDTNADVLFISKKLMAALIENNVFSI